MAKDKSFSPHGTQVFQGWLTKDQWNKLIVAYSDPKELGESYELWVQKCNDFSTMLRDGGLFVHQIKIDVKAFFKWCEKYNREINNKSLGLYAAYKYTHDALDSTA
ncbi:MAG: hypothetical protein K9M19_00125 [Candidatus Marinimicrobia bacterium]|nr:hypothetical protein [Candidatus Neomarinimicrobiota bacterium]